MRRHVKRELVDAAARILDSDKDLKLNVVARQECGEAPLVILAGQLMVDRELIVITRCEVQVVRLVYN
eukprot:2199580-Prymnesium_polylepis.1